MREAFEKRLKKRIRMNPIKPKGYHTIIKKLDE